MKNEKEFYLAYLRNPKKILKNGFDKLEELEVPVVHEYNDYREISTKEKVYIMDINEVFDGHKVFKSQAGFIGRIGRKLTLSEVNELITYIMQNNMKKYSYKLQELIDDTRELTLIKEKEYQNELINFKKNFRK